MLQLPLSWIKEHLDIDKSPQEVADLLTSLGLEVDAIIPESLSFSSVVVGEVTSRVPHPNADKLVLAKVFDGKQEHQVVCGAPNCEEGKKYPFATEGARLTDVKGETFEVRRTKIRGVESFGMLCSGKELMLSDEHDGILELDPKAVTGSDFAKQFTDVIFEISLTPNMGHNLSLLGILRELSAATGVPYRLPEISVKEKIGQKIEEKVSVEVAERQKCPRYCCRLIENVKVGPSPIWLVRKLQACGIRSINNIVDVTNLVMLELGQPMHGFDFDTLKGGKIKVRRAVNGEKILTLDGKECQLSEDLLVIADAEKPIAVAGVIGGEESGVTEATKNVLLESAYFDPSQVRKSCKILGVSTDSSKRFERGVDYEGVKRALDRAAMLIEEISAAQAVEGVIDVSRGPYEPRMVHCRLKRIEEILGVHLSLDEVETILKRLQFSYKWDGKSTFEIEVPSFRHDIQQEIDIIEEVARIFGYDNIPRKGGRYSGSSMEHAPIYLLEREVRMRLINEGLQEFITCDLISEGEASLVTSSKDGLIPVMNPVSIEHSILRPSLIPGLLSVIKHNVDYQTKNVRGFEIGRIHYKVGDQYKEQTAATIVLSGQRDPHHWDGSDSSVDFYDVKGIVENLLEEMRLDGIQFIPSDLSLFHDGRRAKIEVQGQEVGTIGEIHPEIQRTLDIPQRIFVAEVILHGLHAFRKTEEKMKPLAQYPSSDRDWTLTLREEIPIQDILSHIKAIESPYLEEVSLKDVYRSDKIGVTKKNVTLHFIYRDRNKTLSQEEVDLEHGRVTENATELISRYK